MTVQDLPKIGEKLYLMHREVIVRKMYTNFQLVQIHYTGEPTNFFVDICAVTRTPDTTNSISLGLLKGERS